MASSFLPNRDDLGRIVATTAGYAALGVLGLGWGVYRGAGTAVWPASGFAFAVLLVGGVRLWPAIFLGRLLTAILVSSAPPWWGDLLVAAASALSTAAPVAWLKHRSRFDLRLVAVYDIVALLAAGAAGALLSALTGLLVLWLSGAAPSSMPMAFAAWCLGYTSGVIIVAPLILAWRRATQASPRETLGLAASLVLLAAFSVVVLFGLTPFHLRTWHLFPVLAAIAIIFSLRGVTLALLIVSILALASATSGVGPLSEIYTGLAARALYAQQFIAVTGGTLILLAAATDESRAKTIIANARAAKAAVLDAALDAIVTMSGDGKVVDWNDQAEVMFGYTAAEAIGQDLAELIVPESLRQAHRDGLARYLAQGRGSILGRRLELQAIRANGTTFPVELAINVVRLDDAPLFTAYLRDQTEKLAAAARLRVQDQRLRATYAHAPIGIAEVDAEGRFLAVNAQLCEICGRTAPSLIGVKFWDITHEDDHEAERYLFARQMRGELDHYSLEKRYVRPDGAVGWVELRASRVDAADDAPAYGIRVLRDITQERRLAEQQQVLINELNHRVKNTLATVQSVTFQTLRNAGVTGAAQHDIESRLVALSRAHDVLTRENWDGANLGEIIDVAVKAYAPAGARLSVRGPEVRLAPQTALSLAMALQELATNATKYGAWANDEGVVDIVWGDAGGVLDLSWRERGGPPVVTPTRRGFGTRLLQRSLAAELGGACTITFAPEGVVCQITAAL